MNLPENSLLFCAALLILQLFAWRILPASWPAIQLVIRLALFSCLTALLYFSGMNPLREAPWPSSPMEHTIAAILEFSWWIIGARLTTVVLDVFFAPKTWHKERFFQDVLGAIIFLAATIAAGAYVFDFPVHGLLVTSGALAIILGLAIQSTLSDVFSGIVLNTTEPYHPGDTVSIDGTEGKVMEINWREINLLDDQGNIVTIPNTLAAKSKIINLSRPNNIHGISLILKITPSSRPASVITALERAIKGCESILFDPAPSVVVGKADLNAIEYEMICYVDDLSKRYFAINQLYDIAYRQLKAAGIGMRPLGYATESTTIPTSNPEWLIRSVGIFSDLSQTQIQNLAARLVRSAFEIGTTLASANEIPKYLAIIESGVASVRNQGEQGNAQEINRLNPGDSFGEEGILTGRALSVEIVAMTETVAYLLKKEDLTPILQETPEIGIRMCQIISQHNDTIKEKYTADRKEQTTRKGSFFHHLLESMRNFHGLHK